MKAVSQGKNYLFSDTGFGILVSGTAFLCTLGLMVLVHKHYYTTLVAAVGIACLLRGWQAGVAALGTGTLAAALLIPPTFQLQIDTPGEVLTLVVFAFAGGVICLIAYADDRRKRELRIAESQRQSTEKWLQSAQHFTRFWTWEIDPERRLVKWVNPYGELRSQVYEPLDSWMTRIHPDDRSKWLVALDEASFTNSFELQFRVSGPMYDRFYVAKGAMTDDPVSQERRLVGISVQIRSASTPVPVQDESQFALFGVQDLLESLAKNPSLDDRAQRSLTMAREIVNRLVPQETSSQRRVV